MHQDMYIRAFDRMLAERERRAGKCVGHGTRVRPEKTSTTGGRKMGSSLTKWRSVKRAFISDLLRVLGIMYFQLAKVMHC
jgi:hypothetical protein